MFCSLFHIKFGRAKTLPPETFLIRLENDGGAGDEREGSWTTNKMTDTMLITNGNNLG
jgi:hypothetical protein